MMRELEQEVQEEEEEWERIKKDGGRKKSMFSEEKNKKKNKKQAIWRDGITLVTHIQPSRSCLINTWLWLRWFMCMYVLMCLHMCVWVIAERA